MNTFILLLIGSLVTIDANAREIVGSAKSEVTKKEDHTHKDTFACGKVLLEDLGIMSMPEIHSLGPYDANSPILVRDRRHGEDGVYVVDEKGATFFSMKGAEKFSSPNLLNSQPNKAFSVSYNNKSTKLVCPVDKGNSGFCNHGFVGVKNYPEINGEENVADSSLHERMTEVLERAIKSIPSQTLRKRHFANQGYTAKDRKFYDSIAIPKDRTQINKVICQCKQIPALKSVLEETFAPEVKVPGSFVDVFGPFSFCNEVS